MHYRDHVEKVMTHRLLFRRDQDSSVGREEYIRIWNNLQPTVSRVLRRRWVAGFSHEDLRYFMGLKVYQVLQRGGYDARKPLHNFFYASFMRMIADIERLKRYCLKVGYSADPLDEYERLPKMLFREDGEWAEDETSVEEDDALR